MILLPDISKQVHELATTVYQIRGHIKGKTLLPFPQVTRNSKQSASNTYCVEGVEDIDIEERRARESEGKDIDTVLKNNIEQIILKWSYQVI